MWWEPLTSDGFVWLLFPQVAERALWGSSIRFKIWP